jgi:hypothetical protein
MLFCDWVIKLGMTILVAIQIIRDSREEGGCKVSRDLFFTFRTLICKLLGEKSHV